jgi:hypothetical protein
MHKLYEDLRRSLAAHVFSIYIAAYVEQLSIYLLYELVELSLFLESSDTIDKDINKVEYLCTEEVLLSRNEGDCSKVIGNQ